MPHAVRDQLLLRAPEIGLLLVGDEGAPALGTLDPTIPRWLEENEHILISRNRRSMPQHLREHMEAGGHVPGILVLRRRYALGQVIDDLISIWTASTLNEFRDRIEYLPL